MASEVTDATFQKEVIESTIPVLVDFWAEWCGPCKMLGPIIEEVSQELTGKVKIVKMDIDNNPNIPSSLGIRSIPTMMVFNNGQQIATKIGALPKNSIIEWINTVI